MLAETTCLRVVCQIKKSGFLEGVSVSTAREFILSRGHRLDCPSEHDDMESISAGAP